MSERIGVLVGWEHSFPQAFIERANKVPGITAELAKIGATEERFTSPYRVLIDRISQEIPHYRFHLKAAALAGTYCINDPFWWSGDDKFFGYSLVARDGVAVPRTVMLPQKNYIPAIDKQRSLRNLEFPLKWDEIFEYIGFPAILKPADGGGWKNVTVCKNAEDVMRAYDASDTIVMTLQEFIDFDEYIRCICIGQDRVLPIEYNPKLISDTGLRGRYIHHEKEVWLSSRGLHDRVIDDSLKINKALGYDMNSVEFAVRDGVPYAIDFTNPAPDMAIEQLGQRYFDIAVDWMVDFTTAVAKDPSKATYTGYRWERLGGPRAAARAAQGALGGGSGER